MGALGLCVERGAQQGREFLVEGTDAVVIGRDVPGSPARVRLDPGDRSVSRRHCVLELRPPTGLVVRDLGSAHGTQLRRAGSEAWVAVHGSQQIRGGDEIRLGETVLRVRLVPEPPSEPLVATARCIRCQAPMTVTTHGPSFVMRARDYLCSQCRALAPSADRDSVAQVRCEGCGVDVTSFATGDGRADELRDVAGYLCRECARREQELPPRLVGPFQLVSQLGLGGMGVVYRAWDTRCGRVVALKQVLRPLDVPPAHLARFLREIALLQQLEHPNITRFFEAGQQDDVPFFVFEYVPDGDLAPLVSPRGLPLLPVPEAVTLVARALRGVGHAHAAGIVHRDLKPENILLRRQGTSVVPKVTDFGLSRSYERHGGTVTRPGEVAGTLHYLPPEQVLDFRGCGPSVDVYAMGSLLYYLLTGRHPLRLPEPWELSGHDDTLRREYPGLTEGEAMRRVLDDERIPVRDRRPDLPEALAVIVDRAVARDPDHRPVSADQMRTLLEATAGGSDV